MLSLNGQREFLRDARALGMTPRIAGIFLGLHLVGTVFESLGIAMMLPILQFMDAGGEARALAEDSALWRHLVDGYGVLGIEVTLPALLATAFVLLLLRQIFIYWRMVYAARVRFRLVADTRRRGFGRFLAADLGYGDAHQLGDLVNDLTTEVERTASYLFSSLMIAAYAILAVVYLVMLLAISVPMTGAALLVILLALGTLRGIMRRSRAAGDDITDANQDLSRFVVERLKASRLIRLSGTEAAENAEMDRLADRQRHVQEFAHILLARLHVVLEPVVIGLGLLFLGLGHMMLGLGIEEMGVFFLVSLRLLPIAKQAATTRQTALALRASADAVLTRLDEMGRAREAQGGSLRLDRLRDGIRLDGVRYAYPSALSHRVPALNGVDLFIPARRMTALVGPSGAGKSTLIDLLPRLRDPQQGSITIDGIALDDFDVATLRNAIAYVPQSPQVFNVAADTHIRYGRPEATAEEVREAARLAGADDFIRALPNGYDTLVGEEGGRLSGGQRQRLDLARALVRRGPLLILDEPTSNLDADAEEAFRAALARIRRETDMTVIVVGHRLSTTAAADQIVVLERGRVTETGSHDVLMARGGWYARAFAKQQEGAPMPALNVAHG